MNKQAQGIAPGHEICYTEAMICNLCPHECGVDRAVAPGRCGAPDRLKAALVCPFFFEEPPISGSRGCGAVFFSHCNLSCVFCQNHEISAGGCGKEITDQRLAEILAHLAEQDVHTINLVSPTPYTDRIARVLADVRRRPMPPVVWNSNGYEKPETLMLLAGLVDVYLPDLKYLSGQAGRRCSGVEDYPAAAKAAIGQMKRQVGDLVLDEHGVAVRGLMIRHLVLPGMVDESKRVLLWIAEQFGPQTHVSIMSQYYPTHRAHRVPGLDRPVWPAEYEEVCRYAISLGFENGWFQEEGTPDPEFTPRFDLRGI